MSRFKLRDTPIWTCTSGFRSMMPLSISPENRQSASMTTSPYARSVCSIEPVRAASFLPTSTPSSTRQNGPSAGVQPERSFPLKIGSSGRSAGVSARHTSDDTLNRIAEAVVSARQEKCMRRCSWRFAGRWQECSPRRIPRITCRSPPRIAHLVRVWLPLPAGALVK